jgi:hypothetical protein
MRKGKLTKAECERAISVLRRVIVDERETGSLRAAARDELVRLERILAGKLAARREAAA